MISSVTEEISSIKSLFPSVKIITATSSFFTFSYMRTPSSKLKATITFPEDYPNSNLILDIVPYTISDERKHIHTASTIVPGLKKKLEREVQDLLASNINLRGGQGEYNQVEAVIRLLTNFLDENLFVPCWKELKQVTEIIQKLKQHQLSLSKCTNTKTDNLLPMPSVTLNEKTGRIRLKLCRGKYFYSCTVTVNRGYPGTKLNIQLLQYACKLDVIKTNFPDKIEAMMTAQAQDLVRRMQEGMPSEVALSSSNPIRAPRNYKVDKNGEIETRLTRNVLKDLKHDTEILKDVSDLRKVDTEVLEHNAKIKAHDARERKDARRAIKKVTKNEIEKDTNAMDKERNWQMEEKARLEGLISEYDTNNPQPSLLPLVQFLVERIIHMPEEICPICSTPALPKSPDVLKALYEPSSSSPEKGGGSSSSSGKKARQKARQKLPVRSYCGCWFHHGCLNTFMTEPPFGKACLRETCGRRVYHPDYPDSIESLERAWAAKQAREREIEDALMFL